MRKNKGMIWTSLCTVILILSSILSVVNVAAHDTHHTDEYVDIIVRYDETAPSEDELSPEYKNVMTMDLLPIQTMSVPASSIKEISLQPNVKRVTYDQEMETSETAREVASAEWNKEMIGTFDAWDEGYLGNNINVAVLDTGFYDHPEITYAGGFSIFDAEHELGEDDWMNDHDGHGTHVAGIIAAHQNTRAQGSAPGVNLFGIKIYHQSRGNRTSVGNLMMGLSIAIVQGMDIITISSGYPDHNQEMKELIDIAYQQGILIVAASGNTTEDDWEIDYPAAYPEVIAVANIDNNAVHVSDSVISEENELAAPGQSILSLGTPVDGVDHIMMSGTSQATPHVVAIAALLMEKYPNESAQQIRSRMQNKALDLGEAGHDPFYGYGLVQYSEAVEEEPEEEEPEEDNPEEPVENEDEEDTSETDENTNEEQEPEEETEDRPEKGESDVSTDEEEPVNKDETESSDNTDEETDSESETDIPEEDEDEIATRSTVWIRPSTSDGIATISEEDLESVADDGVLAISFDSSLFDIERIHLSEEQIQEIRERSITLLVARIDFEWVIPAENLDSGNALLLFDTAEQTLPYQEYAKSDPMTFSIEQNGEKQTIFPYHMTYRFFTNEPELNQDYLYEWNEENQEWVILGDAYTNGGVVGTSLSTATLAVFNPDELAQMISDATNTEEQEVKKDTPEEQEPEENEPTDGPTDTDESNAISLPVAISGALVILASLGGGFYFFGGKSKED